MSDSGVSGETSDVSMGHENGEDTLADKYQEEATSLQRLALMTIAVEVPAISSPNEYEFLPGHFNVRYIKEEVSSEVNSEPSYTVKLDSGEIETISSSRLQTLENGPEALSSFRNSQIKYQSSTSEEESQESEEDRSSLSISDFAGRRRLRRTRNTKFTEFFGVISSDDEGSRESSSSEDDIVVARPTRMKLRLRKRRKDVYAMESDFDQSAREGTRFSTRRRNVQRYSLRERTEDDISEYETALPKHQKYYGAKETFERLPSDDPFRLRHQETCDVCSTSGDHREKGPLVFCQGCTVAYHKGCLGPRTTREHLVTKVTRDKFLLQCRRCLGVAQTKDPIYPHQGYCATCNKKGNMSEPLRERLTSKQEQQLRQENGGEDPITPVDVDRINNLDNVLFRCKACHRAFHYEHLPSPDDSSGECQDCLSLPGEVGSIVSWRPVNSASEKASEILETEKEYLIKWKDKSYAHCTWMPGSWAWGFINPHMRRAFLRSEKSLTPRMTSEEAIPEDFLRVDIVFDVKYSSDQDDLHVPGQDYEADLQRVDDISQAYVKFKGLPYEEAVWESPPTRSNTESWNDFMSAYEDWVKKAYVSIPNQTCLQKHLTHVRKQKFKSLDSQPDTMTGGEIMDYQQDGLNWLYYKWFKNQNAILADEMGLGKTIQVIALLATLIQYHKCWPFLIVVPNSTCPNWRKEIKTWVPSIRAVTYYGSSFARNLAQDYEMFGRRDSTLRCHVVIASYETMVDDASRRVLSKIPWGGLIVDEGQRLKSDKSQLYEALSRIKFPFKVLMTGTPLQNNTKELFNLLQFCDPTKNSEELEEKYGTLSNDNISELHDLIRPFFLRRTKAQVLTFLPPVAQIIIPVTMSVLQKKLYKSILAKNSQLIQAIFQRSGNEQPLKHTERHSLNNILVQLRKCLCHPFIYSKAIEERSANSTIAHRNLVDAAGKLQLLEIMLPKLHKRGNRVLIFSQFLENLDIMEDFLDGLGLMHRRLDGRMTSLEKQKMIDDYNAEASPYFAFLLSTRSGGVGINLATADTVIIMDPDFNPHQDMQALSRAHRIGQKNKVLVFQLMVRASAEEKIMQIGKKKMALDHVLIDRMTSKEEDGHDLDSILRHGAQALFNDDDSGDVVYTSESVDKLLDRSQVEQAKTPEENDTGSQFSFARVWVNERQNLNDQLQETEEEQMVNSTTWEKILQEREQAAAEEARLKAESLGRGKRKRANVAYAAEPLETSPTKPRSRGGTESDADFNEDAPSCSGSDEDNGEPMELDQPAKRQNVRSFHRVLPDLIPPPAPVAMDGHLDENQNRCLACGHTHPVGNCQLKMAGVEYCGLCGLAHYGIARTCPHLKSEVQVLRMLEAVKQSNEDPALIAMAKKHLQNIRGDLASRKRRQSGQATASFAGQSTARVSPSPPVAATTAPLPPSSSAAPTIGVPVIDLTRNYPPIGDGQSTPMDNPAHLPQFERSPQPPSSGRHFS
ncbi:hypothetical protein AOCH_003486 [Aspergillus ochraceoroseus]|nr:hypothetical protein AOCH_003486 [Aspergillus ochraceoroseus]